MVIRDPQEAHQLLAELPGSLMRRRCCDLVTALRKEMGQPGALPTLNVLLEELLRRNPSPRPQNPEHQQGSLCFWVPLIWGPP